MKRPIVIDCGGDSTYDSVLGLCWGPQERVGRILSRLAGILQHLFVHALRLFHLLIGLVFLFLAIAGASVSYAEWRYYREMPGVGPIRFSLIAGFTVLLFIFCLYSFVKARNVH